MLLSTRATTFARRAPSSASSASLYIVPSHFVVRTFTPSSLNNNNNKINHNLLHFLLIQQPPLFSSSTSSTSIFSIVGQHSFCEATTTKRWASGSSGGGGGGRGSSIPPGTVFLNMPQGLSIPNLTIGNLSLSGLGGRVVVGEEQFVGSSSKLQEEAQKRLKADQRRKAQQLRQAGLVYFSGRQFGLAKQLLTKAASLRDDDMGVNFVAEMLRYIAFADINEGNFGEAIVTLDTYQKIKARMVTNKTGNDELVAIWLLLGATRLMGGCFTEATTHFQRAKDLLGEVTDKRPNNDNTNDYDDNKTPEEQEERMLTPSNFSKTAQSILDSLFEEQQPTTTRNPAHLSLATLIASQQQQQQQQQQQETGGVPYSVVLHTALSILSQTMPLIPLYKAQETLELYRLWETVKTTIAATPQQLQKQKMKKKGHQPPQVKGMTTMMMTDQEVGELATHLEKRASYLIGESKRNEGLLLLEESVELLERVFEENKERVIGLVCKLAERYIYFRRTEKAKLLLQYWKQRNADSKEAEEERERLLEEQARVSSEEERLQEEQKWANNISLHKLDFQLPLHTLTPATATATTTATTTTTTTPPTASPPSQPEGKKSKRQRLEEQQKQLQKAKVEAEKENPLSGASQQQQQSSSSSIVRRGGRKAGGILSPTTSLVVSSSSPSNNNNVWEDIDANEVLLEDHLAMINYVEAHYEQACQQWKWVLDKKQKIYLSTLVRNSSSNSNVDVANTYEHLSHVSTKLGRPHRANKYLRLALEILTETLGVNHKRTQQMRSDLAQQQSAERLRQQQQILLLQSRSLSQQNNNDTDDH